MDRRTRRFLYYAGHRVSLLRLPTFRDPVLGTARPDDTDPRLRLLEESGIDARSPRTEDLPTIDEPLDPKARAALLYETGRPAGRGGEAASDVAARRARHMYAHRHPSRTEDHRATVAARHRSGGHDGNRGR